MRLGYLRASAGSSSAALHTMKVAGCDFVVIDSTQGVHAKLTETLLARLSEMRDGDELVVLRLDHLLPMPALLDVLVKLVQKGVVVESLTDGLSTRDLVVADMFRTLGSYMKTEPGSSRRRGRTPSLTDAEAERARRMIVEEKRPVTEVAAELGVSRATIYRRVPLSRVDELT